ncbi:hypothetical protein KBB27_03625 [Patescibacteria group bacterium]|nr:hypothetical protein [Patescibacteria group bacterium]
MNRAWRERGERDKGKMAHYRNKTKAGRKARRMAERTFGCVTVEARMKEGCGIEVSIYTYGDNYESEDAYHNGKCTSSFSTDVMARAVTEETMRQDKRRAVEWAKRAWPSAMKKKAG